MCAKGHGPPARVRATAWVHDVDDDAHTPAALPLLYLATHGDDGLELKRRGKRSLGTRVLWSGRGRWVCGQLPADPTWFVVIRRGRQAARLTRRPHRAIAIVRADGGVPADPWILPSSDSIKHTREYKRSTLRAHLSALVCGQLEQYGSYWAGQAGLWAQDEFRCPSNLSSFIIYIPF
jgi:hypothetical protein